MYDLVFCYHGGVCGTEGCGLVLLQYQVFLQYLCKVSGGKWRLLCQCDNLHYSHTTVTDGYTPCAISGHASHTIFNLHLPYNKKSLRWTDGDGDTRVREWILSAKETGLTVNDCENFRGGNFGNF